MQPTPQRSDTKIRRRTVIQNALEGITSLKWKQATSIYDAYTPIYDANTPTGYKAYMIETYKNIQRKRTAVDRQTYELADYDEDDSTIFVMALVKIFKSTTTISYFRVN